MKFNDTRLPDFFRALRRKGSRMENITNGERDIKQGITCTSNIPYLHVQVTIDRRLTPRGLRVKEDSRMSLLSGFYSITLSLYVHTLRCAGVARLLRLMGI